MDLKGKVAVVRQHDDNHSVEQQADAAAAAGAYRQSREPRRLKAKYALPCFRYA